MMRVASGGKPAILGILAGVIYDDAAVNHLEDFYAEDLGCPPTLVFGPNDLQLKP